MIIKHFENKKTGSPTERLTFENEKEFESLCESIELHMKLLETVTKDFKEEYVKYQRELLNSLKKKKRMTKTEEGTVPVTFINAEDFHLLTMAFIEAIGW